MSPCISCQYPPAAISSLCLSFSITLCLWLTHSVARLGQISRTIWQYWLQRVVPGLPDWAGNLAQSGNAAHTHTRASIRHTSFKKISFSTKHGVQVRLKISSYDFWSISPSCGEICTTICCFLSISLCLCLICIAYLFYTLLIILFELFLLIPFSLAFLFCQS